MRYPFLGGGGAPAEDTDLSYRPPLPKFNKDLPYKGEVPYESPDPGQNPLARIIKKIGPTRMQGFLSALTAPVHEGESDFAVGLNSYLTGKQGYEDRLRALGGVAEKGLLEERKVKAQETQAEAATSRAASYDVWAHNRAGTTGRVSATDKIKEYMGLPPEQQQAGFDMGLYHHPRPTNASNEDERVAGLIAQTGGKMTEPEARLIISAKPLLLSTGMDFLGKDPKHPSGFTTKREYGVPRRVRQILQKYNMTAEDVMGLSSDPGADTSEGPNNEDEVLDADEETIQHWIMMKQANPQAISDIQWGWIQAELEARREEEEANQGPDEYERNPEGE